MIKAYEETIPFTDISISKILSEFTSLGKKANFSMIEIRKILGKLNFNPESLTNPDSLEYKFIQQLKNEKRLYSFHSIILSGILLASGSTSEKAKVLFKLYDKEKNGRLDMNEVMLMVDQIFEFSVEKIPLIMQDMKVKDIETLNGDDLDKHIRLLKSKQEKLKSDIIDRLLKNEKRIRKKAFIKRICASPVLESLLWSYRIRLALLE